MAERIVYPEWSDYAPERLRSGWLPPRIDWRLVLGAALLGLAVTFTAPAARETVSEFSSGASAMPPAAASLTPAELPQEWRWERKAVRFDGMIRERR